MRKVFVSSLMALVCLTSVALGQNAQERERTDAPRAGKSAKDRGAAEVEAAAQEAARSTRPARDAAGAETRRDAASTTASKTASHGDQQIAALIWGCCKNEIEISRFALDRLQTEQAKAFAEKMIREHSQGCEKIQQLAGNLAGQHDHAADSPAGAVNRELRRDQPGRDQPGREEGAASETKRDTRGKLKSTTAEVKPEGTAVETTTGNEGTGRQGVAAAERHAGENPQHAAGRSGGAHGVDWVSIHKQIGEQCLQSTKQEFERHQGADFDKAYMGQQIVAHMKTLDELKVLRNHATGELRTEIEKSIEMATRHLEEARKIMEQQKDRPSERISGRPNPAAETKREN